VKKFNEIATMRRDLRAIIVEDQPDDLALLLAELERASYAVTYRHVQNERELRAALALDYDIVISDYSLPSFTAHDVVSIVKAVRPEVPCIVISGTITEESAVDVLRAGAADFVVKDRMVRLVPAIDRELRELEERRRLSRNDVALREMRERMQFAMEAVGVGVWESDLRTGRMVWSGVNERLHGLEPGTFGGTFEAWLTTMHADDRPHVLEVIERSAHAQVDSRVEYRTVWPDGSIHWLVGIGRTVLDDAGAAVRAVGVGFDVTAQKTLEDHIRQVQKMESIGSLAAGVAHDFNNLLTVISGECELMAPSVASGSDAAQSLDAIRSAAESATALTRQLLTFSRQQVVVPRLIDLNETLTSFAHVLRRLVEESVSIEFRLTARLDPIRIDPGQLEQIVMNLVANARDAMRGGGRVTIETGQASAGQAMSIPGATLPAGSWVRLSVTDTGTGMSPEVQRRLFDPFFTTKAVGRGTGLGLATVHGIVAQNGGHIFVRSAPGAGATFDIYLPVASGGAEPVAEALGRRTAEAPRGGETILVVDDNNPLRRLTERILTARGYRVLSAATSTQALEISRSHDGEIAIVLTDVVMPEISGPDLVDLIVKQRPAIKVVFMSGYTAEGSRIEAHRFVPKPFTAAQLVEAVSTTLAGRSK
jgi:signal transduction histidine kinase